MVGYLSPCASSQASALAKFLRSRSQDFSSLPGIHTTRIIALGVKGKVLAGLSCHCSPSLERKCLQAFFSKLVDAIS